MNIPLNIDWQQILLHLFNFIILTGGLYFLLYSPVKKFMNKRLKYYKDLDKQANKKIKEINKEKANYEAKIANVNNEISKKRAKAAKESEKIANARIESANIEAKEIVENAKVSAEKEKQRIIESAQREIAAMAVVATKKLLEEQSDSFNQFISATKEGSENE